MLHDTSGLRLKNKVLGFAFFLTALFVLIFFFSIYITEKKHISETRTTFVNTLHNTISHTIQETIDHYTTLASTVLETTETKKLMAEGKREALYALLESKWKLWSTINPDLKIMLFHKADGTAFLRMHKPAVYGDYLNDIRPMVKAAHSLQTVLTGYETGKYSTVFRLLTPIFYEGEYLGTLDFGINPNYFVNEIYHGTGHRGLFFVKKRDLKLFKRESDYAFGEYLLQSRAEPAVAHMLDNLPASFPFKETQEWSFEGMDYLLHSESLNDYLGESKGQLLFFYDISDSVGHQSTFTLMLTFTAIIFLILMLLLLNGSFNKLLSRLNAMHVKHTRALQKEQQQSAFNEKYLNAVLDTSKNMVISTVGDDQLYSANKAFLAFTGFESAEAFSREHTCVSEIFEVVERDDYVYQDKGGVNWIEYIRREPAHQYKVNISKEGQVHTFLLNGNLMTLDEKERHVFSFTDITKLISYQSLVKEKDQLLYQQSKLAAMGEMISMIAHQWRQPLAAVAAAASSMRVKLSLDLFESDLFDNKLKDINDYIQHMSKTIDDFRNFYKPDKEKESLYLKEAVDVSLNIIRSGLTGNSIAINTEYLTDKRITTYKNELIQVFLNILKNAQDALTEHPVANPEITIRVSEMETGGQRIVFEDNAGGIPETFMEKIFEPYFSSKDEKNGTGLGLYMSKIMIEEHCGGTIEADNTPEGARFTITLPDQV